MCVSVFKHVCVCVSVCVCVCVNVCACMCMSMYVLIIGYLRDECDVIFVVGCCCVLVFVVCGCATL